MIEDLENAPEGLTVECIRILRHAHRLRDICATFLLRIHHKTQNGRVTHWGIGIMITHFAVVKIPYIWP